MRDTDNINVTTDTVSKGNSNTPWSGSMESDDLHEAKNHNAPPIDTEVFFQERGKMLDKNRVDGDNDGGGGENENKVLLKPMTPLTASSTVVNLLLATGPFS